MKNERTVKVGTGLTDVKTFRDRASQGLEEDVITDLSHSKDCAVIARNSTDVYKGKSVDIRTHGHDLNVKYVLEGSVRRDSGNKRDAGPAQFFGDERADLPGLPIGGLASGDDEIDVADRLDAGGNDLSGAEGIEADEGRIG